MRVSSSDVCVIGGGVIGLAVAAVLRERGVDVVCYERSLPGGGQSSGRTRQFRHLHADRGMIELAIRARQAWVDWEQRYQTTLLGSEGALRVGANPHELDALRAAGLPAEELDARAACELFPVATLPDGMLLWDPLAGAIRASNTIAALAGSLGGALRQTEVSRIEPAADSVAVQTTDGEHHSARCLVCAGAGTDRLVRPIGLEVRQLRNAHLRLSFRARARPRTPFPCFSDRSAGTELVYALSDLGDRYAVGLSELSTYPPLADLTSEMPPDADLSSQRERIIAYVRRVLPGLDPDPVDEVRCVTTTLPDQPDDGFAYWQDGPVTAIAGTNLFKFAPVVGAQLADAAIGVISPAAA